MSEITAIEIRYSDGQIITIYANDLEKLERIAESMGILERARQMYETLRSLFAQGGDKK
jgi:hypothetical protein